MVDLFEALEIGEPGIVSGSRALCLLLDCASVLPLGVHETDLVLADDSGTHIVSHGIIVVVDLVFGGVVVGSGDVELTGAETVTGLRDSILVGGRFDGAGNGCADAVGVLVETRTGQLLRLVQVQFVHVQLLPHGETSGFIVGGTAKSMPVLIGTRPRHVSMTINIGHDFIYVRFLHILTANSERIRLSAVLVVWDVLTHDLAH